MWRAVSVAARNPSGASRAWWLLAAMASPSPPPPPRVVRLGERDVAFPSAELAQIEDSSALLDLADGGAALRARLARDGFLFLRGALGRAPVLAARAVVLRHLRAKGDVLAPEDEAAAAAAEAEAETAAASASASESKVAAPGGAAAGAAAEPPQLLLEACNLGCLPMMEGVNSVTHAPATLAVLDGAPLRRAVGLALGTAPEALATFDYKWLRAVGRRTFTGCHCDSVYMARGSPALMTAWIPLEPRASLELGALAMCRGSHDLPGLARVRATYAAFDTEAEPGFEGSGWLTSDPFDVTRREPAAQWVAGDYEAGDVILFQMRTLHMSTANLTERVRISCDVRFQPAAEPIDERYMGSMEEMKAKAALRKKGGAWASDGKDAAAADVVTMADLRKRWGLDEP